MGIGNIIGRALLRTSNPMHTEIRNNENFPRKTGFFDGRKVVIQNAKKQYHLTEQLKSLINTQDDANVIESCLNNINKEKSRYSPYFTSRIPPSTLKEKIWKKLIKGFKDANLMDKIKEYNDDKYKYVNKKYLGLKAQELVVNAYNSTIPTHNIRMTANRIQREIDKVPEDFIRTALKKMSTEKLAQREGELTKEASVAE